MFQSALRAEARSDTQQKAHREPIYLRFNPRSAPKHGATSGANLAGANLYKFQSALRAEARSDLLL